MNSAPGNTSKAPMYRSGHSPALKVTTNKSKQK